MKHRLEELASGQSLRRGPRLRMVILRCGKQRGAYSSTVPKSAGHSVIEIYFKD